TLHSICLTFSFRKRHCRFLDNIGVITVPGTSPPPRAHRWSGVRSMGWGWEDKGAADRALAATPGSLAVSWWWSLESPEDTASPKLCAAPAFNPSLWERCHLPSTLPYFLPCAARSYRCNCGAAFLLPG
ncbi:hypothetical protein CIB84_016650, partial [Bambusicola thoracicus]